MMSPALSAVIITRDEAKNIEDCLRSVRFCSERVVVDSGSRDHTVRLARAAGAVVCERVFDHFAAQKNFGIQKASGDWVLLLDADERVTEALKEEILETLAAPSADGYAFPRQNRIFGRWMKHGANTGDVQLRLVKRSEARFYGRVHERVRLKGKIKKMKNPLLHYTTDTISDYMKKLNAYTDLEAETLAERAPVETLLGMKQKPLLRLLQLIFLKQAFLDGLEGFLFAVLSAYYDFVSHAKHWERAQKGEGAS